MSTARPTAFFNSTGVVSGLQCRLPLIVGVTGHRDLRAQDIAELERAIRDVLKRVVEDCLENEPETPIVLMSSLAEGADQLAAGVALEMGASLIAPLPFSVDEYRRDFQPGLTSTGGERFDSLLARAMAAPEIPLLYGATIDDLRADPERRALQYREAGLYIVRHCHILLALWDGEENEMPTGGAAEVVQSKSQGAAFGGASDIRDVIDGAEIGPIIVVNTPRARSGKAASVFTRPWGRQLAQGAASHGVADDQVQAWREFEQQIKLTTGFNADARRMLSSRNGPEKVKQSLVQLLDARGTGVSARGLALHDASLWCATFAVADVLAQSFQKKFTDTWTLIFVLAFLMAVAFNYPVHDEADKLYKLGANLGLFLTSLTLWWVARRQGLQAKYLDYRTLSEAARVAVFWKVARIDKDVSRNYPICQSWELSWIKLCLRSLECLGRDHPKFETPFDNLRYRVCHEVWVRGQFDYFRNRGRIHDRTVKRRSFWSAQSVVVSTLGFGLMALAQYLSFDWKRFLAPGAANYVSFALLLLPVGAALFEGHAEKLGRTAQALQYDRMRLLFERVLRILPSTIEPHQAAVAQDALVELGREALNETASWTSIFRVRPLRVM